jgi:hypothetical protein
MDKTNLLKQVKGLNAIYSKKGLSAQFSPKPFSWPENLLKKKRGGEGKEEGRDVRRLAFIVRRRNHWRNEGEANQSEFGEKALERGSIELFSKKRGQKVPAQHQHE